MKNLILPALLLILLSSCSKYQMNMISSTNMGKNENSGIFNTENDSLKISYSFKGQNAPISITVYNKMDKPLYISWPQSAFIVGDKAVSYADNLVITTGQLFGAGVRGNGLRYFSGAVNAISQLPENITFIPPHTQITRVPMNAIDQLFNNIPDSAFRTSDLSNTADSKPVRVKIAQFTQDNTPLEFKSYLTMYTMNDNTPKTLTYLQDFFVSQVIQTLVNPNDFDYYNRADYFYISKTTTYGKIMTGVALTGLVTATAALDASVNKTR